MLRNRARSTSAAPGFFKPFSPARQESRLPEWIDGAILHNNPVERAIEEARRLSKLDRLNPVPDVVLSIGAGLSSRVRHLGEITSQQSYWGLPKAKTTGLLRRLFMTDSYQAELNTDADRRWPKSSRPNGTCASICTASIRIY